MIFRECLLDSEFYVYARKFIANVVFCIMEEQLLVYLLRMSIFLLMIFQKSVVTDKDFPEFELRDIIQPLVIVYTFSIIVF